MKLIDLTNQQFGKWTVLRKAYPKEIVNKCKGTYWLCQCSCGNQVIVLGDSLRQGKSKQCVNCKKLHTAEDLTGQIFNRLTIIRRATKEEKYYENDKSAIWLCQCICGKYTFVRANDLKKGTIKSCSCYLKENPYKKDITNQKFGKLIALKPTDKRRNESIIWECKCDCGNIHYATQNDLSSGQVMSCGCLVSKGEAQLQKILTELNINFKTQAQFQNCVFPDSNSYAKFDFYLPQYNIIIEYDGKQHFYFDNKGWNTKEQFEYTKRHDDFKNNYCKENNISLIRIPYYDYQKLNCDYVLDLLKQKGVII